MGYHIRVRVIELRNNCLGISHTCDKKIFTYVVFTFSYATVMEYHMYVILKR